MNAVHFHFVFKWQAAATSAIENHLAHFFRCIAFPLDLTPGSLRVAHRVRVISRLVLVWQLDPGRFAVNRVLVSCRDALPRMEYLDVGRINTLKVVHTLFVHPLLLLAFLPVGELIHVHVKALRQIVAPLLLDLSSYA